MKTIGLSIAIGASVGAALSGLNSLASKTSSIGKLVDGLGAKKINLIANDKNVLKLSKELTDIDVQLDLLKQKKIELPLRLDKTKVDELNSSIRKIKDKIDKLRDKESLIELQIKTTTDEKELKKLNRKLATTRKNIIKLSSEKIELKDELIEVQEANEKVNKEIKKTKQEIDILNSKKITLKEELKEAEQQAEKTNKKIKAIDSVVHSINKSKIKIEAIVANRNEFKNKIIETVALASSVVVPLKTSISFESSLADVKKVTDFDERGIKKFGSKIIDLSNNKIPMFREELLSLSAEMAQLGIKDKQLLDYTKLTAKMSVAWDMEASDTGEAVGKMKNIFKLNLAGVKKIGDAINHLSNNTSAKASEMIVAMKKVGGIANSFGMSAIKTTALVDTFIALGEEPENAATGINSLLGELNNIGSASKKAKKAFNKLGLSTRYFKNEIKANASGALMHFLEKLKKVDKINRSAIAIDIFGKDHSPKILKLVDSLDEYKKALKLVDVNSKSFKIDVLSESFARLSLAPKKSQKAIKDLAVAFDDLDFNNDKIWETFKELKIDDKKFKIKLDKNEDGAIDEFLNSIKKLDKAQQLKITTKLFGAEKAKKVLSQLQDVKDYKLKVDVSTKSIAKTIRKLSALDFSSKKVGDIFKKMGMSAKRFGIDIEKNTDQAFIKLLKNIKKLDKATQKEAIVNLVGKDEAKTIFNLTGGLDEYLKKIEEVNKEKNFANSVEREFQARSATTANSLQLLSNSFSSIGVNLGTLFLPAINSLSKFFRGVSNSIGSFITEFPTLSKYVGGVAGGFLAIAVGGATLGFALGFIRAGLIRTTMLFNVLRGGLILNVGGLKMLGRTIAFVARAMLLNPIGLAVTAIAGGAYLIYSNWEGVSSWFSAKWESVKGIFSSAWSGIKTVFSWSPIGLISTTWQSILGFFGGIGTGVKNFLGSAWNGLKSIISWNPLTFISGKWQGVLNYFNSFSLFGAGKKIVSSVVDGLSATWGKLTKKVGDIAKSIRDFFPFSPAKRGALTDIHRIKLMETIAQGINDKPLLSKINNSTKKVRKALAVTGAGIALGGTLAVAQPMPVQKALESEALAPKSLPTLKDRNFNTIENLKLSNINPVADRSFQTKELYSQANIPKVFNRSFETKENLLTKSLPTLKDRNFNTIENLKLSNINPVADRSFQTKEILLSANIPKISNRVFETKENLLTKSLPTLQDRQFNTIENLKLSNINPVADRSFQTKEIISQANIEQFEPPKPFTIAPSEAVAGQNQETNTHNYVNNSQIYVTIGDIIVKTTDGKVAEPRLLQEEIQQLVQDGIQQAQENNQDRHFYDIGGLG